MRRQKLWFAFFVVIAIGCSVCAAQPKVLTPELILTIKTIVDVQLSPNGKTIVFQVSRPRRDDEKPGGAISELWTMPTTGGEPTRFTYNEKSERMPRWSPNGK